MRLLKIEDQIRRDFWGTYECEGCGHKETNVSGYDDRYFHDNVTPEMKCENCGESTNSLGKKPQKVATKYPAHQVV